MAALPLETNLLSLIHDNLNPQPPSLVETPAAISACVIGNRLLKDAIRPANMLARTCSLLEFHSNAHPLLVAVIDAPDVVRFRLRLHRILLKLQMPRARLNAFFAHHLTRRLEELCLDAERLIEPVFIMATNIQTEALQAARSELEQAERLNAVLSNEEPLI